LLVLPALAPAQWSVPVPCPNLNGNLGEFDPCPSITGGVIYFTSNRVGSWDLYRATRTTPLGAFGPPAHLAELANPATDFGPCPRIDDLELFFVSNRAGGTGDFDIWRARRASPSAPFDPPTPVNELNTTDRDLGPSLTATGLQIVFQRGYDLWTATRPNWNAPFGPAIPITELNSTNQELEPHVTPDGLAIFFTSQRPGGMGQNDTWLATRLSVNHPFGIPQNLVALNGASDDWSPAIGLYRDEIFFTSNRSSSATYDLYTSRFTGLVALGTAGPSSMQSLRFSDPSGGGLPYLGAASFATSRGILIDTRVVPLSPDALFQFTLGGRPPLFNAFAGMLSQDGIAAGTIAFFGMPELLGARFFNAFVVLDARSPSGIRTISNAHEVLIQ
jgi:hypothetical protein